MAASSRRVHWAAAALLFCFLGALDDLTGASVTYLPAEARATVLGAALLMGIASCRVSTRRTDADGALVPWLLAASAGFALAGAVRFYAFPTPVSRGASVSATLVSAVLLGGAAGGMWKGLVSPALRMGMVAHWMHPFRLLGLLIVIGLWLSLVAQLSLLQRATLVGVLFGLTVLGVQAVSGWLRGRSRRSDRVLGASAVALVLVEALWLGHTREVTPLGEIASYPDPIVFATGTERRYVVTSAPSGFELFIDHQVAVSSLDRGRYGAALTRPVLGAHPSPERVLVLGGGSGVVERAVLEDARVRALVVVTPDAELPALARRLRWLDTRGALADPRLELVVAEPAVWVARAADHFDVIIADLAAPVDYMAGKHYTTSFVARVKALLAPSGVAVIPAGSAMQAPRAFAATVATARAAGLAVRPYHVGITTLGEWSFLLAARESPPTPRVGGSSRFFTTGTLAAALAQTPDRSPGMSPPSSLHEQLTVAHFREERGLDAP